MARKYFVDFAGIVAAAFAVVGLVASAAASDRFPIDLKELQAQAEKRFAEADADGDGSVSAEEFAGLDTRRGFDGRPGFRDAKRAADSERGERGRRMQPWSERAGGRFEIADRDADGQLSAQEFEDMPKAVRAARQEQLFARLDADGDGKLALDEFSSRTQRLARLDSDGDGEITRAEMPRRRPRP